MAARTLQRAQRNLDITNISQEYSEITSTLSLLPAELHSRTSQALATLVSSDAAGSLSVALSGVEELLNNLVMISAANKLPITATGHEDHEALPDQPAKRQRLNASSDVKTDEAALQDAPESQPHASAIANRLSQLAASAVAQHLLSAPADIHPADSVPQLWERVTTLLQHQAFADGAHALLQAALVDCLPLLLVADRHWAKVDARLKRTHSSLPVTAAHKELLLDLMQGPDPNVVAPAPVLVAAAEALTQHAELYPCMIDVADVLLDRLLASSVTEGLWQDVAALLLQLYKQHSEDLRQVLQPAAEELQRHASDALETLGRARYSSRQALLAVDLLVLTCQLLHSSSDAEDGEEEAAEEQQGAAGADDRNGTGKGGSSRAQAAARLVQVAVELRSWSNAGRLAGLYTFLAGSKEAAALLGRAARVVKSLDEVCCLAGMAWC